MRNLLLIVAFLLTASIARAGSFTVTITYNDNLVPPVIWALENFFLNDADTDQSGSVSGAEAIAFFQVKMQEVFDAWSGKLVRLAGINNPSSLPAAAQTAISDADAAITSREEAYDSLANSQ